MSGFEEILGYLANRLGLDLRTMSAQRRFFVVALYSLLGLALLIGGSYSILAHSDDGVAILGGALCALIGAAWLARITVNIVVFMRDRRTS